MNRFFLTALRRNQPQVSWPREDSPEGGAAPTPASSELWCSRDNLCSSPASVMKAGSFQTGREVVTQNPHFFQACRKPSLSPQEAVLFPSGEGRKWENLENLLSSVLWCTLTSRRQESRSAGSKQWRYLSCSNRNALVWAGIFTRRYQRQLPQSKRKRIWGWLPLRNVDGFWRTHIYTCLFFFPLSRLIIVTLFIST